MGYTIRQKIDICLKAEANPEMTQADLALWARDQYGSLKPPSQTTISRILSCKNELIATKDSELELIRRRKQLNPLLRRILTEWITQAIWENIPITIPIIRQTANSIWNRLSTDDKVGNGIFNPNWCNNFIKKLNINVTGTKEEIAKNPGHYNLNKVWKLDEKLELKTYLKNLISKEGYSVKDIFTVDEFQLFYSLPLDQLFDVSSIDKGLKQSSSPTANSLTIMLGCNIDGSEKLTPLIVGKYDTFDVSGSSNTGLKSFSNDITSASHIHETLMNKLTEAYQVSYKSNVNKWITSSMFQDYLLALEHKLTSLNPKRKILILLDDSSSHRIINMSFQNIRLCYLKNSLKHRNPYNLSYSGVKFDFLPMSFGIVEEFKILYRTQQYLDKINLQKQKSNIKVERRDSNELQNMNYKDGGQGMEVLTEADYQIPIVRVIEWIKNAWEAITPQKIFDSWKKTNLINFKSQWEVLDDNMSQLISNSLLSDSKKSYNMLLEIMTYLNVVIPWEIEELLGLVNEKGKITFSYVSIEEIIGSCLLETYPVASTSSNDIESSSQVLNSLLEDGTKINDFSPLERLPNGKHQLFHDDSWDFTKRRLLSISTQSEENGQVKNQASIFKPTFLPSHIETIQLLEQVILLAKNATIPLQQRTIDDLEQSLLRLKLQQKLL